MDRARWRLLAIVAIAVVAVTGTATARLLDPDGVAAAPTGTAPTGTGVPPVIAPGRPGGSAAVRAPGEVVVDPQRYTAADAWYVRMMIPHHRQALQMATLAPDRAADPRIAAFAERVKAGQEVEIGRLRAWLDERRLTAGEDHDHLGMPGMQTQEAMRALADARGVAFDRLFTQMMTTHHRGAIEMSTDVLRTGTDGTVAELATSIAAEQAAEIDRMRDLLAG